MSATYAVSSFAGVHHLRSGLLKGDNHHKDPMILFSLTSSRYRLNTCIAAHRFQFYYRHPKNFSKTAIIQKSFCTHNISMLIINVNMS